MITKLYNSFLIFYILFYLLFFIITEHFCILILCYVTQNRLSEIADQQCVTIDRNLKVLRSLNQKTNAFVINDYEDQQQHHIVTTQRQPRADVFSNFEIGSGF